MLYGGAGGGMDAEADMARKRRCARRPACCPARPFAAPANAFKLHTIRFPPPRTDRKPAPEPARPFANPQACKRPSTPAFTAKTKSKFQAPKTPLSHGFRGFVAIDAGAKKWRGGVARGVQRWARFCGPLLGEAAMPPYAALRSLPACSEHGVASASSSSNGFAFRTMRSFFRSKFQAPKTPLSHGFSGLAAIRVVAESVAAFRARRQSARLSWVCGHALCARGRASRAASRLKFQSLPRPVGEAGNGRFCCKNRSQFRGLKTPLSHGFRGFVAIEKVAKEAMVSGARAVVGLTKRFGPGFQESSLPGLASRRASASRVARTVSASSSTCESMPACSQAARRWVCAM